MVEASDLMATKVFIFFLKGLRASSTADRSRVSHSLLFVTKNRSWPEWRCFLLR